MSAAMSQLEAALIAKGIQVPKGALQQLLDQKNWMYRSKRVEDLLDKLKKRRRALLCLQLQASH